MTDLTAQEIEEIRNYENQIKLAESEMVNPRRLMREVDRLLTLWGRIYFYNDKREICKETGIKALLGQLVKRANKENNVHSGNIVEFTDERFERVNAVVVKMPVYYRAFVCRHYIIDEERPEHRNERPVTEFCRLIDMCRSDYNEELYEAKQLAVAYGII